MCFFYACAPTNNTLRRLCEIHILNPFRPFCVEHKPRLIQRCLWLHTITQHKLCALLCINAPVVCSARSICLFAYSHLCSLRAVVVAVNKYWFWFVASGRQFAACDVEAARTLQKHAPHTHIHRANRMGVYSESIWLPERINFFWLITPWIITIKLRASIVNNVWAGIQKKCVFIVYSFTNCIALNILQSSSIIDHCIGLKIMRTENQFQL